MMHAKGVHFIQFLYNFSGEEDGSGIYEGSNEIKVKRNQYRDP